MSVRSEVIRIYNELLAGAKKISALPAAGALTGNELVEGVQGGANVKMTTQDIADLGGGGGGAVSSVFSRTGAVTAQAGDYSKSDVGLGNVDNTSDANKPVSTAQATADGLRVLKAGDTMSGNLAMGSNKVTGLAAASANGDAVRYEQIVSGSLSSPASKLFMYNNFI